MENSVTTFWVGGGLSTSPITIRRRVSQGDPISPVLFHFVMDEVLEDLYELHAGLLQGEHRIPALAYADNQLVMSTSREEQQILVRRCDRFLQARGMAINPNKCAHLGIRLLASKKKRRLPTSLSVSSRFTRSVPTGTLNIWAYSLG